MKSQARSIWEHISKRRKPFTANEVAEKLKVDAQTVRHYFSYWKDRDAMEVDGKESDIGKLGRPRVLWRVISKEFIAVWR